MDHHCYFIGNCIGENNQKMFFQYAFYVFAMNIILIPLFSEFVYENIKSSEKMNLPILRSFIIMNFTSMYAFTIIIPTFIIHVFRGQTLIENKFIRRQYSPYRNPYDLGIKDNFKKVFGRPGFLFYRWILPL